MTVQLPVKTVGQSEGVKAGGKLVLKLRKLKVRGLIYKMPENIEIDITKLAIGNNSKYATCFEIHRTHTSHCRAGPIF